jgi:chitodextrinase
MDSSPVQNEVPSVPLSQNNSTNSPLKPIGQTFIEHGVNHTNPIYAIDTNRDQIPIIDIQEINNGSINQTIVFNASGSIDPDGAIISYAWDFGDGTTGTGKTSNHSYTEPGVYQVNLTVTDNTEKTSTKTFQVTIGAYTKATAKSQSSSFSYASIALLFIVCAIGIGMMIYLRRNPQESLSGKSLVDHMKKIEHSIEEEVDLLLFQKFNK